MLIHPNARLKNDEKIVCTSSPITNCEVFSQKGAAFKAFEQTN